jgi:hypothetical protein
MQPPAFDSGIGEELLLLLHDGTIKRSTDLREDDNLLNAA